MSVTQLDDDQLRALFAKVINKGPMSDLALEQARNFIPALFDVLPIAGYLDSDGITFAEEEWMLNDPTPVYVRAK